MTDRAPTSMTWQMWGRGRARRPRTRPGQARRNAGQRL